MSNLSLATVIVARANFVGDPTENQRGSSVGGGRTRGAYLLRGDQALFDAEGAQGPLVCSAFIDARGHKTEGWLPSSAIKPVVAPPHWEGKWRRDEAAEIEITRSKTSGLELSGEATHGAGGATHVGELEATLDSHLSAQAFSLDAMSGEQRSYDKAGESDYAVRLRQFGPYIFVVDNGRCGGADVSFTGMYARR
jgi:hypothetical protein